MKLFNIAFDVNRFDTSILTVFSPLTALLRQFKVKIATFNNESLFHHGNQNDQLLTSLKQIFSCFVNYIHSEHKIRGKLNSKNVILYHREPYRSVAVYRVAPGSGVHVQELQGVYSRETELNDRITNELKVL